LIEALPKLYSQRLAYEDSVTKAEVERKVRNTASTLMKERREWLEVISLDGSIKNVRSGSMPSSPTRKILVPRWNKCTSSHLPKDEKEVRDLQLWV